MSSDSSDREELVKILPLLKKLIKRPECEFFRTPFLHEEAGFFDYPYIISQPMDMSTVIDRISNNYYCKLPLPALNDSTKVEEIGNKNKLINLIIQDVRLIWRNAMVYNAPGTLVYNHAKSMSSQWVSVLILLHYV